MAQRQADLHLAASSQLQPCGVRSGSSVRLGVAAVRGWVLEPRSAVQQQQ